LDLFLREGVFKWGAPLGGKGIGLQVKLQAKICKFIILHNKAGKSTAGKSPVNVTAKIVYSSKDLVQFHQKTSIHAGKLL